MLEARAVTFRYFENAKSAVLENINLSLEAGTITLLCGKSGCGKSTLAHILAGLYPENGGFLAGNVFIDGVDIHQLGARERVKYSGMLFQNADLQFCMDTPRNELFFCGENTGKIAENCFNQANNTHVEFAAFNKKIEDLAQKIGVFHLLDRKFAEMSGGEKQKCAFCCILALGSKVLILDEAFANIDFAAARELAVLVKKSGLTVLAVEHNTDIWEGIFDRVFSLDGTKISANFPLKTHFRRGNPIIEASGLRVKGISYPQMMFENGCITAILGTSGCGKTTFFTTLIGQHRYEGSLLLDGQEISSHKRRNLYAQCGLVFQNPANQFLALNVYDEVHFSVAAAFHPKSGIFTSKKIREKNAAVIAQKTQELLALFDLAQYAHFPPYLLSQGQQRRLGVLIMLAGAQKILLLDEPTYGQDFENCAAIMHVLEERANRGLTVIFNTHSEKTARAYADKIVYIEDGAKKENLCPIF